MRLLSLFLSIVFLFSAVPAGADFEIKNWRYEKTIQLPRLSRTGLVELSFDEEVFANASQGLRDVRILDSNGQETPYKLVVERKAVERASLTGRVLDKSFIPGEYSFFVIDLGQAGLFHNQVDIRSSSLNFRREAIVEASNDAKTWSVVNRKAIIYDYTDAEAGLKARNTRIKYPESTKRYLRIKVINKDEEPLNISGAAVFYEKATLATAVSYSATIIEQSIDEERRASRLVLDLGSSGLPNNSLSIQTSSSNFQRDIGIEGSNDKEKWNIVKSRDVIFAFRTPKFTGSKFNVGYPENTYRYLRLTIFNRDNPPLNIQGVNVSGVLRTLVFEVNPALSYKLFYGNPDARYPQYDIERYFQYLETENLHKATLVAGIANPLFEEKVPPPPPVTDRFPWLLPVVIGVAALILLVPLIRLIKQARNVLPPPEE